MKPITPSYSTSPEPAKKKSYSNGSAGKKYHVGKNTKATFDGKKVSKKVHSNINFSKLDEVCLDVGKVDLSFSARLKNDSGLSPPKGPREWNGEIHEVSFMDGYGDTDKCTVHVGGINEYENLKTIRSCYVQLESLGHPRKSSFGIDPRVSGTVFRGTEDEEWKGWTSDISFSQQHGCPLVRIAEGSKVSEVLVMDEDLVDSECQILEKCNGYKLNRSNFKSSVLGTCDGDSDSEKKSCEEKNIELKEKLQEFFKGSRELQNFCECIDFSVFSPQFQTSPQNKSCIRKLNFASGRMDVPSISNRNVGAGREASKPNVCPDMHSNCEKETNMFCGFTDGAIFLSENYARGFLDYYDKVNFQNEIII